MNEQQAVPTNGLIDKVKNLFDINKKTDIVIPPSSDNRREGETYMMWGKRVCGIVCGSLQALPPYLHKVYNDIYQVLASDATAQRIARAQIEVEIEQKNNELRTIYDNIDAINSQITRITSKEEDLKEEREEIKRRKEEVNKEQRLKLIIGLSIIIPLTFYLFLFYSSTFYSAFFRDPSSLTTIMNSMFDSNALSNAYADGLAELGFVLSAPIIFLGLGFVLHFFSVQKNKIKYLKMAAIVVVTVMFDSILAYKIGEQMHSFGVIIGEHPIGEEYTITMAIQDINTWAVIFCGFIVYVIWGIVFDMCMSAYEKLDLNKIRLESIKIELSDCERKMQEKTAECQELQQNVLNLRNAISNLTSQLGQTILIDYARIRSEMNNFFAGWITMMQVLSICQEKQDEANEIYQGAMASLLQK